MAAYVSLEDNARCPVGQGDPSLHLATLCREAALDLSMLRHPSASKQVSPEVQRLRDDETLQVVSGILRYVLASGLDPASPALLQNLDAVPTDILPVKTRADIVALQALVQDAEADAKAQLHQVRFFDARFPRLDGRGVLESRVAITEKGGKRLDAMLRERHGADVVVIAADSYTWTAAEPTSGASLRGVAAAFEAMERQVARTAGFDRVPGPSDRVQPGWSVKNPYYLGGTDSFIITPRGALLTTADRLEILHTVAGMRQAEAV